ncbi:sodium/potassium/calcium exchanger 3-like isoform X2 [Phlebotomus papatasi]|uniref:sodium/potassium/calcium exchanger 3-like isoform X2 n=1 Tax=Phlebotomus papatasi TaxID=29031 RepID=UPI00248433AD|nr:sodium/potassium/calcium exchanger 3-like isoform X2 [Phlebotomus papatasi]
MKTRISRRIQTRVTFLLRILIFLGVTVFYLVIPNTGSDANGQSKSYFVSGHSLPRRHLVSFMEDIPQIHSVRLDPIARVSPVVNGAEGYELNCTPAAILEFPSDGLTREQRQSGWIAIHVILVCYLFWLLAVVCDEYFVPAIESMCDSLKMKKDIAGATFMAAACSSSELFINCVGTFITEGDIGVGTIVGSAVFNILAVPACCGLIAGQIVLLDWWPVSRDCLMYGFAVVALISTLYDGRVMWYEALCLVSAYVIYIVAICCNDMIARKAQTVVHSCGEQFNGSAKCCTKPPKTVNEGSPLMDGVQRLKNGYTKDHTASTVDVSVTENCATSESDDCVAGGPWARKDESMFMFICRWPIAFLLWFTIPDCRRFPRLRFLTFITCVIWIGASSYVVAFLITAIGDTLNVPDSVMGLTFLAAGTSVPEAVSSVIVANKGHGTMGISNSIGSNTFDIMLCLGLPWLIKSLAFPATPGEHWVSLKSSGMTYSATLLLSALVGLYVSLLINKFKLDWKVGATCTFFYLFFLIISSMLELNFFFPVNLPTCDH